MELTVTTVPADACTVVHVAGDLDPHTGPELRSHVLDLVDSGRYHLVLDLEGVDFMDSTGLGILVAVLKRVREHDGSLRLVCTRPPILKILQITGLDALFPVYGSLAEVPPL